MLQRASFVSSAVLQSGKTYFRTKDFLEGERRGSLWGKMRAAKKPKGPLMLEIQAGIVKFSTSLETDIPLREKYEVPFEAYLAGRERVFSAFFPDKQRSEPLGEDSWRVHMLPINFFFLSARPVVDMALLLDEPKSTDNVRGKANRVLRLEATKWELRGIDYNPSEFELMLNGSLFAERFEKRAPRLRGRMSVRVKIIVPQALILLPHESIQAVGKAVLDQLLGSMKDKVNRQVIEDYSAFSFEQWKSRNRNAQKSITM